MTPASHPVSKPASMGLRCQPPQDTPRIFEDWLIALESVNVPHRQIFKEGDGPGKVCQAGQRKNRQERSCQASLSPGSASVCLRPGLREAVFASCVF